MFQVNMKSKLHVPGLIVNDSSANVIPK